MNTFYVIPSNYDLIHHGVKGQKWGVRRYQNEDGSLTNAGKRQALRSIEKNRRIERKLIRKENKYDRKYRAKLTNEMDIKYNKERVALARNEKEKMKEYKRQFLLTGMPDSYDDFASNGLSTKWADEIRKTEGEAYANKVLKSSNNTIISSAVITSAAAIGAYAVATYINNK